MNGGENDTCVGEGSDGQVAKLAKAKCLLLYLNGEPTRTRCIAWNSAHLLGGNLDGREFGKRRNGYMYMYGTGCSDMHLKPSQHG